MGNWCGSWLDGYCGILGLALLTSSGCEGEHREYKLEALGGDGGVKRDGTTSGSSVPRSSQNEGTTVGGTPSKEAQSSTATAAGPASEAQVTGETPAVVAMAAADAGGSAMTRDASSNSPAAGSQPGAGAPPTNEPTTPAPAPPAIPPPELLAAGATCFGNAECINSLCVDSVCCQEQCGICEACVGPGGSCVRVVDDVDPDTCGAPQRCGALAKCLRVDQQQALETFNVALAGASVSRFAQVVLPAVSGQLAELFLNLYCSQGTITVDLQQVTAGEPNGVVLLSIVPNLATNGALTRVVIDPPLTVQAGFPFAIVLSARTEESCSVTAQSDDPYPRGSAFLEDPRAVGEWFASPNDLRFESWVVSTGQ